tara:strand:+ start:6968 stop:7507 length:540 start_codon:yes stop_codon:yes gene_type:complete
MPVNPAKYSGFHRGVGDESNKPVLEILVPGEGTETYARAVHVAQAAAANTDWDIAANANVEWYLHATTNPATEYMRLGGHDGTTCYIDNVGGTTVAFQIDGATELDLTATVLNLADGNILYVGVEATPGTTAGSNWIGIEDSATDPAGTLTNSLALYTPDAGDSLDFLHADGTTDSLGT